MNRKHFFAALIVLSLLVVGLQLAFADEPYITVAIDIKPGSYPNSFNIDGHGVIPVAILGSEDLDVSKIRPESLALEGLRVGVKGNDNPQCSIKDVSGDFTTPEGAPDGYPDLVCQFVDEPFLWQGGEDTATLYGELQLDENTIIEIVGSDGIKIVP